MKFKIISALILVVSANALSADCGDIEKAILKTEIKYGVTDKPGINKRQTDLLYLCKAGEDEAANGIKPKDEGEGIIKTYGVFSEMGNMNSDSARKLMVQMLNNNISYMYGYSGMVSGE